MKEIFHVQNWELGESFRATDNIIHRIDMKARLDQKHVKGVKGMG